MAQDFVAGKYAVRGDGLNGLHIGIGHFLLLLVICKPKAILKIHRCFVKLRMALVYDQKAMMVDGGLHFLHDIAFFAVFLPQEALVNGKKRGVFVVW